MVKICFCDFGGNFVNLFLHWESMLQLKDCVFDPESPDFLFTSVFGTEQYSNPQKRIFFNFENRLRWHWHPYKDTENMLLAVVTNKSVDYPDFAKEKVVYAPGFMLNKNMLEPRKRLSLKKKFCCIVVSAQDQGFGCFLRENFFRKLSQYKQVDSAGKCFNNTGYFAPEGDDYFDWISQYKFMITFENSFGHGYVTEKIFNGFKGGAVPIYWCDIPAAKYYFNDFPYLSLKVVVCFSSTAVEIFLRHKQI